MLKRNEHFKFLRLITKIKKKNAQGLEGRGYSSNSSFPGCAYVYEGEEFVSLKTFIKILPVQSIETQKYLLDLTGVVSRGGGGREGTKDFQELKATETRIECVHRGGSTGGG